MNNQKFLITSLVMIVLASFLTSLIGMNLFSSSILKGPSQEGTIEISGLAPSLVDVIIIDNSVVAGIEDTVKFTGVTFGQTYMTDLDPATIYPFPFVIRNNGNVDAQIEIDERRSALQPDLGLFDDPASQLRYWVEDAQPILTNGYNMLDNCAPLGGCRRTTDSCESSASALTYICTIPRAGNGRTTAIAKLSHEDTKDEAFLHIYIQIASTEAGGQKSTILTLTGSQA